MQKLLLELGGPLVIAVVLLAIARMVRDMMARFRGETGEDNAEARGAQGRAETDEVDDEPRQ